MKEVPKWHVWAAVPIAALDRLERWLGTNQDRNLAIVAGVVLVIVLVISEAVR